MLSKDDIYDLFKPLWDDAETENSYPTVRPLLAHYTSITTLEQIMKNDEIWFSNPLNMNDMQELRFGIREASVAFRKHPAILQVCGKEAYIKLVGAFDYYLDRFQNQDAFDVYVFCTTRHDVKTKKGDASDGVLSMWRGYGGNGTGAAIVFDTACFDFNQDINFLLLSDVNYLTPDELSSWIDSKLVEFASLLNRFQIPEDMLHVPAYMLFERFKVFSLFTKHHGFSEENEWRVVYLRERDSDKVLDGMLHYSISPNGPEPKLKFKVKPIPNVTGESFSLTNIVRQILLGPSVSGPLAVMSVKRMLRAVAKPELADQVAASTTPFRSL